MKIPEYVEISNEILDSKGVGKKSKLDFMEVRNGDIIQLRFSREHYRYHNYKVIEATSYKIKAERAK